MPKTELSVGSRIREYEILEIIGKGGMGAVFRARHVYLDEERAIKVIHSRLAEEKDLTERFIREAKILTKLRHPNLVQFHEFGTLDEDSFFMVLEFLRGESVLQRLRRVARIPVEESIKIIREAALGLHSAHQKGIVHRDISPDNLLLVKEESGNEITKVIDFGIAKPLIEGTHQFTATNMFVGKPEYCSPEQCGVLEEGELIDHRSDIYSLAVTFYQMIAGKLPFYAATPQGYLVKHAKDPPKPISSHFAPGQFPVPLDRFVHKALAKNRNERHSSMEEFVRELDRAVFYEQTVTAEFPLTAPQPATWELKQGEFFAQRYLIERKIGEGGMGSVYHAVDKMLEVPVALKVMNARVVDNEKTLERFKREVILARKVAHPNVCRIYDIGESGGIHYVSMEFVDGKTLADILNHERRLSSEAGIRIIKQVLHALEEAHRAGVIHRDLKPQNIMVDVSGRAHIMDFGISISASTDVRRVTETGVVIGTPHYMAPEQFEDQEVDQRTDIYSLGVIMYQVFTGRLPFEATTPMAVIMAHLKTTPPKPSEIVPDILPELEAIIVKALDKEPQKRHQSTHEFLRALEALQPEPQTRTSAPIQSKFETAQMPESGKPIPSPPSDSTVSMGEQEAPPLEPVTPVSPPSRRQLLRYGVPAAVMVLVALWLGLPALRHDTTTSSTRSTTTPQQAVSNKELVAANRLPVTIVAAPWARVNVMPLNKEIKIPILPESDRFTPCHFSLPEGEYSVELINDSLSQQVVKKIKVDPQGTNTFVFTMPAYDVEKLVAETEKYLE